MVTEQQKLRRGIRRELTDPAGRSYRLQAAPSGYVQWSRGGAQGPIDFVVHVLGTSLVNRLVFRGGWTVVLWQGDRFAPMRHRVSKQRFRTREEAVAALENLAATVERSGPPSR